MRRIPSSLSLSTAVVLCALVEPVVGSEAPPRVILVSLDGAGHDMTSRLVEEGRLPNFARLIAEGAWSDGMVTSFPSKTAAAHAMLFTGLYGHTNGITGNTVLKLPVEGFSRLETTSGYFSGPLRVEPIWVTTAKAGLRSYVLHGTQVYPFGEEANLDELYIAHGYTETRIRAATIPPRDIATPSADWVVPEARGTEAREIAFRVGDSGFWGLFFDDPFDPTPGCDTLGVVTSRDAEHFVARVKAGDDASFSAPVSTSTSGKDVSFSLRLFALSRDASDFVLFRTGAVELAVSSPSFPGSGMPVFTAYDGNGGVRAYERGELGTPLFRGGDGTAEKRLMETETHLQLQILAQIRLVLNEDYRLVVLYSPVSDEIAHLLVGYGSPALEGYDETVAEKIWNVIASAFALQDRLLGELMAAAERDSAHVLVVSDHGMAPTDRLVHLNIALERAGLLALDGERRIDLSRTRALALPFAHPSVAVNLVDRPGGIVPVEEKAGVLGEVRRVLTSLTDPETGDHVVTEILEPSTSGLLQPGGATTGDLFVELAPRYYASTATASGRIIERTEPRGNHGFLPTRRDMRAIFGALGPRVPAGINVGRVRGIDVVPTVRDLLDLDPAVSLPGRSLVPERGLLQSTR